MLLVAVLLCSGTAAFAYEEIWQNGIKYELFNNGTVVCSAWVSDAFNMETANIPEKIAYGGREYVVRHIDEYAFSECNRLA